MRLLADENFDTNILLGIWDRIPNAHLECVEDLIPKADDTQILNYAAEHGYIVLTQDDDTMPFFFRYIRDEEGLPVPGLFLVIKETPMGTVVDSLELIIRASDESEWIGRIEYIPLR